MKRYEQAKEIYKNMGVDTDAAIKKLQDIKISIHCWQGDDVGGFESSDSLSGGIAVTGNYPYKATNANELMQDIDKALTLIPGTHRINLHAIYAITDGESVSRDKLEPKHFDKWIEFAKERGLGLDFNPTLFSHEKVVDGLTLSSPKEEVRQFWIDHCKATRKIAEYIGKELGSPCLHNIWIPDGFKDVPADKLTPRLRLKNSLDEIYSEKLDKNCIIDSVESKVFGLGMESYTTGSHEFYLNYASKNNILCLLDNGHFHPTEKVSDKISSMLLFSDKVALHVTRPVRWDSDHVVLFDEELVDIAKEIIRCDATERVLIGLDYFDASINRIAAWVVGTRNVLKALMFACLMPNEKLQKLQDNAEFTELMILHEELKLYPFADVWDHYCELNNVPVKSEWLKDIKEYEDKYLKIRNI